jgi:hypothetical protein
MINTYWLLFVIISCVDAFGSKLVSDQYCELPMEVGSKMMGKPTVMDETYSLKLYRKDMTEVFSEGIAQSLYI